MGTGGRFLVNVAFASYLPPARISLATLTVNVVGSFLIALISEVALETTLLNANARLFLTVGVVGG